MRKIVPIGDLHGRNCWKTIVEREPDADLYIFSGDYFDSFRIPGVEQKRNFLELIEFKELNPEKVILLAGNHDLHYIVPNVAYPGYQHGLAYDFAEIINKNLNKFKVCEIVGDFVFSHAGISEVWVRDVANITHPYNQIVNDLDALLLSDRGRKLLLYNPHGDGSSIDASPLWIRPNTLDRVNAFSDMIQVYGHTRRSNVLVDDHSINIDCLPLEYVTITDGEIEIKKLKDV